MSPTLCLPLNAKPDCDAYFTPHPEDNLCGVQCEAYSELWQGVSIAHPPPDPQQTEEAVVRAALSAHANLHTVTANRASPS